MTRELQNANEALAQANERLAEANQQLTTIDKSRLLLTRTVSHELRNILNALSGSVSVLDEETDESVRRKMILILHRNIEEMSTLLHQLLDYSVLLQEAYTHKVEPVEAKWLFEEIVAAYEPLTEAAGMCLEAIFDPALGTVVTNRLKVQQISRNLLSNALKYGKPLDKNTSGTVSFSFSSISPQQWKITVADFGMGIPKEEQAMVFEEFYRMPSNSGKIHGTGLGLPITRTLVQVLGGKIEVHSESGKGTCFEVILPTNREAQTQG